MASGIRGALEGIVTATPTPLTAGGMVDGAAVKRLASSLVEAGAAGLAPTGGTGEYTALSDAQRRDMVRATVEAVAGRIPVIAGVLTPGLADTIAQGKMLLAEGADALMVLTPYYARPTQSGIVTYFERLTEALDCDLVLYEIPYRTGIALKPETVEAISRLTRVVAMKACNQDIAQQAAVLDAAGANMAILSGEEHVFPTHVMLGARGGVLATSCLFPRLWAEIYALARAGHLERARALHRRVMIAVDALFAEHNPGPLKAACAWLGQSQGEVLPPLEPASAALRARLAAVLPPVLEEERALAKRAAAA